MVRLIGPKIMVPTHTTHGMKHVDKASATGLLVLLASWLAVGCIGPAGAVKPCPCTCDNA
jgi:hypothetical protein